MLTVTKHLIIPYDLDVPNHITRESLGENIHKMYNNCDVPDSLSYDGNPRQVDEG